MKNEFCGMDVPCPILTRKQPSHRPYVYLDNGASTPSLKCVQEAINVYLPYYSSVHRGTGFKSLLSTHLFESCRSQILAFLDADASEHVCLFTRNTTESINKLARRFPFTQERNIVLTTAMEHHADDLPWRALAPRTVHVDVTQDGMLDLTDLQQKLSQYGKQVALVAITGASNVTGIMNPIHDIARMTHEVGAQIMVDCAQLIAHRKVDMGRLSDPGHLDYVAFSGHKMYAPFGVGVLVGRLDTFNIGEPDVRGGGAVSLVTLETVIWAPAPERDEAGSPNVLGVVALFAAVKKLQSIGMQAIADHESKLTRYALKKLKTVPGIKLFGDTDYNNSDCRVGVIPFTLKTISPHLVAAILGHEFGIGVRSGCFCAHPLVGKLLGMTDYIMNEYASEIKKGNTPEKPGLIRISFGMHNDESDVDAVVDALRLIAAGKYHQQYEEKNGEYYPLGWTSEYFDAYVNIDAIVHSGNGHANSKINDLNGNVGCIINGSESQRPKIKNAKMKHVFSRIKDAFSRKNGYVEYKVNGVNGKQGIAVYSSVDTIQ